MKKAPQDVNIVDAIKPIPVEIKGKKQPSLTPTTTEEEDLNTAGQRKVNLIWERTQALIAILVCVCTMVASIILVIAMTFYKSEAVQIPTIFSVGFGTVIGFYFSRTNHAAIGGIGNKPTQEYKGR